MKQIAQSQRGGELRVVDVPVPALRPEGVLVRTAYSLISAGTERAKVDLAKKSLLGKALARPDQVRQVVRMARNAGIQATVQKVMNRLDALNPLGYSSAGVIVGVGDQVRDLAVGDRVACAGAGYANHAEFAYVPRNLCARVPDGVALDDAAYATVGAIALQGIRQSGVVLGEAVGVVGLGLLGLLTVQMLRSAGCRVAGFDPNRERCELAKRLGADIALHPGDEDIENAVRVLAPYGLDAVILTAATSSSDPIRLAGTLARDRARVVVVGAVGMDIPRSPFYEKELDVRLSRSYGPGRYDPAYEESGHDYPIGYVRWTEGRNLSAFLDLLGRRSVDLGPLTTHRFDIGDAEAAYDIIEGKSGQPFLGVLLEYRHDESKRPSVIEVRPPAPKRGSIGVGFVGAGNFAQSMLMPHLRGRDDVRLHTIATPSGLTARSVAEKFGFEAATSDNGAVIAASGVDLVMIASRHDAHAATVAAALRAGKSVFVEKPLAVSEEELRDVIDAYRAGFLMVGFNRRFAPLTTRLREFTRSMNEPKMMTYRVNAGFIPRDHWTQQSSNGGRIIGEACHFVDLMLDIAASPIVEVTAHALPDGGRYSRDNVAAILRFEDGSAGTLVYSANGAPALEKERFEVLGGGKAAVLDDFKKLTLYSGTKAVVHRSAPDKGHRAEVLATIDAVRRNGPAPIPFEQLVMTTRATFAIVESLATGGPVAVTAE
ncbi:MAG TPA: bi-domain-containing oxidoreductase [Thermoanaerobaculia bacterium]|jgi:polar amino acid transport system substrate-binding protein|nr:bi-domain-containing oxidoreductase [Thermoanaerobaculia bacterium]